MTCGVAGHATSEPGIPDAVSLPCLTPSLLGTTALGCVSCTPGQVKDKIGVLRTLITKADTIIIGGRMAFTFLAALGTEVGQTQASVLSRRRPS
eukprot:365986-Chlamydomonas_euryale.AAC.11